jgi:hypothetical protein
MADDLDRIEQALSKRLKARASTNARPREPFTVAKIAVEGRRRSAPNDVQVLFGAVTFVAFVAVSLSVFSTRAPGTPSPTAGEAGSAAPSVSTWSVEASSPSNGQSLGGLVVELPDGWHVQKRTAIASMSSLVGYLTMVDAQSHAHRLVRRRPAI